MPKIRTMRTGFMGLCLVSGLLAAAFTVTAQDTADKLMRGWYVRGGVGPEFMQNSRLSLDSSKADAKTKFDTGLSFDATIGYRFCPCFSLEAQTGVLYNNIRSISGSSRTRADLTQVPLMVNLMFQLPVCPYFIPYVGAGAGFSADTIDFRHGGNRTSIQGTSLKGDDTDYVFAAQALAGVKVPITKRMSVGLGYKFLTTTRPEWDGNSFDSNHSFNNLVLREPFTHSVLAQFIFQL